MLSGLRVLRRVIRTIQERHSLVWLVIMECIEMEHYNEYRAMN